MTLTDEQRAHARDTPLKITFTIGRDILRNGSRVGQIETGMPGGKRCWWLRFLDSSGVGQEQPIPRFEKLRDAKAEAVKILTRARGADCTEFRHSPRSRG